MGANAPRAFFDGTLKQIDAALPEEAKKPQIGDTFALLSRAHEQTRTELLRDASGKVLQRLAIVTPEGHREAVAGVAWEALFGQGNERPERYLEKVDRDALEIRTATAAHECLRLTTQQRQALGEKVSNDSLEYKALLRWEEVLGKILDDEFEIATAADGRACTVVHRSSDKKGRYRLGSTVDWEATFRKHGDFCRVPAGRGYNANIAVTTNFIREINAMQGAAPDSTGVADLIGNQKEHLGVVPPKFIYDRAAGMPKIFADVDRISDGLTQLVARLIEYGKNKERFSPSDFTLTLAGDLICPNGKVATKAYKSGSADGRNYRFQPDQCKGCPLLDKCRGTEVKPDKYRQVFISDYAYYQREAIAYTKTDAFKLDMKLRPNVERIIAGAVAF